MLKNVIYLINVSFAYQAYSKSYKFFTLVIIEIIRGMNKKTMMNINYKQ